MWKTSLALGEKNAQQKTQKNKTKCETCIDISPELYTDGKEAEGVMFNTIIH